MQVLSISVGYRIHFYVFGQKTRWSNFSIRLMLHTHTWGAVIVIKGVKIKIDPTVDIKYVPM